MIRAARILIVNNYRGPGLGGGEVQLRALAPRLIDRGHTVAFALPIGSGLSAAFRDSAVQAIEMTMEARSLGAVIRGIRGLVGTFEPDILMGTGYLTNLLVRAAARDHACIVVNQVAVVPGAERSDGSGRIAAAVRRLADTVKRSRVDAFIAVSEAVASELAARGVAPKRLSVIHNGIDIGEIEREVRAAAPPDVPAGPVIACVARLEPVKGVEYLVRAMPNVPAASLVIVGDGSQASRLRELAVALGVSDRVRFAGYDPAAVRWLACADVVAVPSLSEAFGLVPLEAMALGKPVVATEVGGLPEVVRHDTTGLLVPAAVPGALAHALQSILADSELATRYGTAGRQRARSAFSVDAMADAYDRVFCRLLAQRD